MDAVTSPDAGRESRRRLLTACVLLLLVSAIAGCSTIQRLRAEDHEELVQVVEKLGGQVLDIDWDADVDVEIEPATDKPNLQAPHLQKGETAFEFSIPQISLELQWLKLSKKINGDIYYVILGDSLFFDMMPGSPDRQRIGDKELRELARLPAMSRVRSLTLEGTSVTDAGLKCLAKLHRLQSVDLRNTRVTAEGAKRLKLALPNCKIEI
jgi:hypothetical protein